MRAICAWSYVVVRIALVSVAVLAVAIATGWVTPAGADRHGARPAGHHARVLRATTRPAALPALRRSILATTGADLSITKTDSPDPVTVGDHLTYTIIVTNNGPDPAPSVTVDDTQNAGATTVTGPTTSQGTCLGSFGFGFTQFTCDLGSLASGASATITFVVNPLIVSTPGTITNTATVAASNDPNPGNNVAVAVTTVNPAPTADLAVSKSHTPEPVSVGSDLTYQLGAFNNGLGPAAGVTLTDTLPAGVAFVSAISTQGTCGQSAGVVTCDLGAFDPFGNALVTIVVRPSNVGTLDNTATISSATPDPDTTNNSSSDRATVVPRGADLAVSKFHSPEPAAVGQSLTYSVQVSNNGPDAASAVTLTDNLPAGVTVVSVTASNGTCTQAAGIVTCSFGTIDRGFGASVEIVVTPTAAGTIVNTADVASTTTDPDASNNHVADTATVNATPHADLSIFKSDAPDPVSVGSDLTYSIGLHNSGPNTATGVVVTDALPAQVSFVSATPSQGACSAGSGVVTCNLGSVPQGFFVVLITIHVVPTAAGTIVNQASVASSSIDDNPTNNDSGPVETTVSATPIADLSIDKTDFYFDPVSVGNNVLYVLDVFNSGPDTAANVVVTDPLPAGLTFVSAVFDSQLAGTCSVASGTVTCSLASLPSQGFAQILITATATATGVVTNTASVTSGTVDPNPANNSSSQQTTITPASADLDIQKTASPSPASAGQELSYTLSVSNAGPNDAASVTVTDTLPLTVTYGSATPSQGTCSQVAGTVTCQLGTLPTGQFATVTIVVTPTAAGAIINSASIASPTPDPRSVNNTASVITTVNAPQNADLSITKSASPSPATVGRDLTYTLNVGNAGPDQAEVVTVMDTLPAAATFGSATATQGSCSQTAGVVTCNLGSLASGAGATVTIVVTPTSVGIITNSAAVRSSTNDPHTTDNTASVQTTVNPAPSADLSVTKRATPDPTTVGGRLTYLVDVVNAGPSTAEDVSVTDTLPASVDFVSAVSTQGSCLQAAGTVTCNLGSLASLQGAGITIVVTPTAPGVISNSATVSSTTGDPNTANNSASVQVTVNPSADLSIQKSDTPDPVTAGAQLTYTLAVHNAGPSGAQGVTVTDTLPASVSFVSASASQGSCVQAAGTVTCSLGALAGGGDATVTVVVVPNVAGSITNRADVSSSTGDPNGANNSATADTTVTPAPTADLSIQKSDSPDPVLVGTQLTYALVVHNAGPSGAQGVTVTDTLPASVSFVSASASQGSCVQAAGTVTCSLGALANGGDATVTVVVVPNVAGSITNRADVSSSTGDPNGANNSATAVTTVSSVALPAADLSISKTDSPDPVLVGGNLTYTLAVHNAGPDSAASVLVSDVLPAGAAFVSAGASVGSCSGTGTVSCSLGSLASGADATVTIVVSPSVAGSLSNTATVSAATADPVAANNSSTATTTVSSVAVPAADLSIQKTDSPDPVLVGGGLTYLLAVHNAGPDSAASVLVSDLLPAGATFVSASSSVGSCSGTSTISCSLGSLASGADATVTIVVSPSVAGSLSNTATVAAATADPAAANNSSTATTTVQAPTTNQPPDCSSVVATPNVLWPPNHSLRTVTLLGGSDPDGDPVTITVTGVTQNEPTGSAPDAVLGPAPNQVQLRAERLGTGHGRTYVVTYVVSDGHGGSCAGTVTVTVPSHQPLTSTSAGTARAGASARRFSSFGRS